MALLRSGKPVNEAPQRNRSRIWSFHLYVGGALKKTLRSDVFSLDHASGLQVERGGRTPRFNSRRDVWIWPRNNWQRCSLPIISRPNPDVPSAIVSWSPSPALDLETGSMIKRKHVASERLLQGASDIQMKAPDS